MTALAGSRRFFYHLGWRLGGQRGAGRTGAGGGSEQEGIEFTSRLLRYDGWPGNTGERRARIELEHLQFMNAISQYGYDALELMFRELTTEFLLELTSGPEGTFKCNEVVIANDCDDDQHEGYIAIMCDYEEGRDIAYLYHIRRDGNDFFTGRSSTTKRFIRYEGRGAVEEAKAHLEALLLVEE